MKTARIVIGANFGDEGKGLITDYYAAQNGTDALVVRHNGGAQAGHTVTAPDGTRHVFSHFGAGSFAQADTFLSSFFVANPLLYRKEYDILRGKSVTPTVYIDAEAIITTPFDMMINQIAEESRGTNRHGSCGMGFGETIERNLSDTYTLQAQDLSDTATLRQKLHTIQKHWVPHRLQQLGIRNLSDTWQERIASESIIDKFIEDTEFFLDTATIAPDGFLSTTKKQIVFEGAQGLLLDQTRGHFPHVTRSNTGIKNACALATDAGIEKIDVTYITRAYLTRHGAGPLNGELPHAPYDGIEDKTNITNTYQGHLRFAHLDLDVLTSSIKQDLSDAPNGLSLTAGIAVTCLDQVDDTVSFTDQGKTQTIARDDFAPLLQQKTQTNFRLESRGATRQTIQPVF